MPDKWVVDQDYPDGHLVPMTEDEEAQLERDRDAGISLAKAALAEAFAEEERTRALLDARAEIASGSLFASLSPDERRVIDLLLSAR